MCTLPSHGVAADARGAQPSHPFYAISLGSFHRSVKSPLLPSWRFLDRRVWNGIDGDFAGRVEDECPSDGTIELAVELRRRRKAAFCFPNAFFRSAGKSSYASFALSSSYSTSVAAASEFTADSASSVSFASVSFSSLSVSSRRSAKSS